MVDISVVCSYYGLHAFTSQLITAGASPCRDRFMVVVIVIIVAMDVMVMVMMWLWLSFDL